MIKTFKEGRLEVIVSESREELGRLAAERIEKRINEILMHQPEVRIIFAAAPSQDEVLHHLTMSKGIVWNRLVAFQMDEYIGLPKDAPQLFQNYLDQHLFSLVPFKKVNRINSGSTGWSDECKRYSRAVGESPIDVICMGIGENGHIAFNDPGVADFGDKEIMKVVKLDEACRIQQVNDGCFANVGAVPQYAYTLTVPTLFSGRHLFASVPGIRKAKAARDTIKGPINENCPATILRDHHDAVLFLDKDSNSLLDS